MHSLTIALIPTLFTFLTTAVAQTCNNPSVQLVPPTFSLQPSVAQYTACDVGADGPKVSPINTTAYDWWYFDAVSDDGTESLVVVFFTSSALGFPFEFTGAVDATTVTVFATYADGTSSLTPLLASGARIETKGDGASGTWTASGASFTGAEDLSTYDVEIDNLLGGVRGTFHLESVSYYLLERRISSLSMRWLCVWLLTEWWNCSSDRAITPAARLLEVRMKSSFHMWVGLM